MTEEVKDAQIDTTEPERVKSTEEVHAALTDIVSKGLEKLEEDRENLNKEYLEM